MSIMPTKTGAKQMIIDLYNGFIFEYIGQHLFIATIIALFVLYVMFKLYHYLRTPSV